MRYLPHMQPRWQIQNPDPEVTVSIQRTTGCHRAMAAVLANRNLVSNRTIRDFLEARLEGLTPPEHLKDLDIASKRIHRALKNKERILIVGDYDVDGITAAALLTEFLSRAGADVSYHLPHRIKEGYGFQPAHVTQIAVPLKAGLIITVDCGISSNEAVETARRFGIDTIITDHHSCTDNLPNATAVINPKRSPPDNPLQSLAGVGVAFYLAIGLRKLLRQRHWWVSRPEPNLKDFCDLVALGTVADMVSLLGVNRILVKSGIDRLNRNPRPGLAELMATCGIQPGRLSAEDISFRLAPRINAAGRVAHPGAAMALLQAAGQNEAHHAAETLCALNARRQTIEQQILDEIARRLERHPFLVDGKCLVMAGKGWHPGVIGIVAAKLANRYFKPAIVIGVENGLGKGSARSIPGIDIYQALELCAPVLERFGGHRMAAGLTVSSANIGRLQAAFEEAVEKLDGTCETGPTVAIDCELDFGEITPKLMDELESLQPFGTDNPAPVFMARKVVATECITIGRKHLKMRLCQPTKGDQTIEAIQFNSQAPLGGGKAFEKIAYRLQRRYYNGKVSLQAIVENVL